MKIAIGPLRDIESQSVSFSQSNGYSAYNGLSFKEYGCELGSYMFVYLISRVLKRSVVLNLLRR